jgi:hypothetical protein
MIDDALPLMVFRILTLVVLVGFLPVCGYTYFAYRIGQRKLEIKRILHLLKITSTYRNIYTEDIGWMHFFISVVFTMSIAIFGFSALLFSKDLGLADGQSLLLIGTQLSNPVCTKSGHLEAYQHGALLAFGLGFLGAYLWGLQGLFRRYSMNDLLPIAFYNFGLRMILSSFIALLIYHAVGGFSCDGSASNNDSLLLLPTTDGILIITVFLVGMFPQRGIRWLSSRFGLSGKDNYPGGRNLPLNMIEGMTAYDIFRLEELGIDTCFDLANTDFIPLLLKTSYGARELIDWLLQAKLCVHFGEDTEELRRRGIRLITDFEGIDESTMDKLAKETSLTLPSLQRATTVSVTDQNIERLKRAAELLGHYWEGEEHNENDTL